MRPDRRGIAPTLETPQSLKNLATLRAAQTAWGGRAAARSNGSPLAGATTVLPKHFRERVETQPLGPRCNATWDAQPTNGLAAAILL